MQLLRADVLDETRREEVISLISRLNEALVSPEVAIDDKHTPKLYGRFLHSLLNKQIGEEAEPMYTESPSTVDTSGNSSTSGPRSFTTYDAESSRDLNPSISVEYAPLGGEPHVELLHGADGSAPSSYQPLSHYDQFSTTSSTIGDGHETATQHSGDHALQHDEMLPTMHILSNPQFYDHMLMPPFNPPQWDHIPESYPDPAFAANTDLPQDYSQYHHSFQGNMT